MNGVRIAASFLGGRASSLIWTSVLQNGRPYTPRKKNLNIEILCKFESRMNLHFFLLIERWNSDGSERRWLAWTSLHWTSYLLISCKGRKAGMFMVSKSFMLWLSYPTNHCIMQSFHWDWLYSVWRDTLTQLTKIFCTKSWWLLVIQRNGCTEV
jgi:hypothetical protein